jgi:hypothetical protein
MALEPKGDDKREDEPLEAPSLPPPSKAVQRVRRAKVSVDIWASNEEVEYERRANQVDLEADDIGAAIPKEKSKHNKKKKAKKPPLEIYYLDRLGQVQGPYPKAQMQSWFAAGFFPPTTMVKTNRNDAWIPVGDLPALQPESKNDSTLEESGGVDDEEANNDLQSRIAALKKEMTVEERIAALKQQNQVSDNPSDEQSSAIQDRIAALRAAHRPDTNDDTNDTSLPPPPPPTRQELPHEYPVDEDDPPYPINDNNNTSPPPSYPLDEHDMAPYPTGDEPPPYPVDDEDNDAYPVDDSYPISDSYPLPEDDSGEGAYPVTEAYPVIDEYPESGVDDNNYEYPTPSVQDDDAPVYPLPPAPTQADQQQKKVVKVDKDVVAFMPSNLIHRKKRKATTQGPTLPKKVTQVTSTKPPTQDDYDKFMEEIEGIGEED